MLVFMGIILARLHMLWPVDNISIWSQVGNTLLKHKVNNMNIDNNKKHNNQILVISIERF